MMAISRGILTPSRRWRLNSYERPKNFRRELYVSPLLFCSSVYPVFSVVNYFFYSRVKISHSEFTLMNLRLVNLRLVNVKATWLWPLEPVAVGAGKASRGLCSRYVGDYCTFHQKLQEYLQVGVQGSGGVVRRSGYGPARSVHAVDSK